MASSTNEKGMNVTAITIFALFGMYLMSLQVGNGSTGYATCLSDGNFMLTGIAIVGLILIFILIKRPLFGNETVKSVLVKSKRKTTSRRRK